jgi:hypothetical protein
MKTVNFESQIKSQFAKIFTSDDWTTFKFMSDYYFKTASKISIKSIDIDEPFKLMCRNIQKRLFIGIGTELLLKSLFLKNDYCINRVKKNKNPVLKKPTQFSSIINIENLDPEETYTLNNFIENISALITPSNNVQFLNGLKTAKVFRNKEGHVVTLWHKHNPQNYSDIEFSIMEIYKKGFNENLDFQISFEKGEKAMFNKK